MSHFYADIQGNRGMATRQGTKSSGIDGHIRGWGVGARVICRHNEETGKDTVTVYRTGGSRGYTSERLVAQFTEGEEE